MLVWIQQFFMQILIWLLGLTDSLFAVFSAAAGIEEVDTTTNETMSLGTYFMSLDGVRKAFFIIVIASVGICAVCTVAAVVKSIVNMKGGERKSHVRTVGQSVGSIFVTFAMAIVMVVGITAADGLLRAVNNAMNGGENMQMSAEIINISVHEGYRRDTQNVQGLNEFDADGHVTHIAYFYAYQTENNLCLGGSAVPEFDPDGSIASGFEPAEFVANPLLPAVPGTKLVKWIDKSTGLPYADLNDCYTVSDSPDADGYYTYTVKNEILSVLTFESGWLVENGSDYIRDNYPSIWRMSVYDIFGTEKSGFVFPSGWKYDGIVNPDNFNFAIAYICTVIVFIALAAATLGLVKRLFDIVLLFLALPGISATIPLDDGAKFKIWRETLISKIMLAFGSVLAVNVFFIVAPTLWSVSIPGANIFTNAVFKLVLICGGALTINGGQLLFSRLVGGDASESREMTQGMRTMFAGGAALTRGAKALGRGLFGMRNANGQRVGGLIKGGANAVGKIGGGAVNAAGTALGGQAYRDSKIHRGVAATRRALAGFSSSAGWLSNGGGENNRTLGSSVSDAIGKGAAKLGGKFADSKFAQKTGLAAGILGAPLSAAAGRGIKGMDLTDLHNNTPGAAQAARSAKNKK